MLFQDTSSSIFTDVPAPRTNFCLSTSSQPLRPYYGAFGRMHSETDNVSRSKCRADVNVTDVTRLQPKFAVQSVCSG